MAKVQSDGVKTSSTTGTSIANIDAQLSQEAALMRKRLGQSTGNRLKVSQTGFLTPEDVNLGTSVEMVVIDFMSWNNFYLTKFVQGDTTPPDCYARGREIDSMKPEDDSPSKQADFCKPCPMNQFGSGENGRSKACRNSRELAVLLVDPENPESHLAPDAPIYILSVPPTSIQAFDKFANGVGSTLGGPPIKAQVTVTITPKGSYSLLSFTDVVANPHYKEVYPRRNETEDMLNRKPDFEAYKARQAAAKPARRGPSSRR